MPVSMMQTAVGKAVVELPVASPALPIGVPVQLRLTRIDHCVRSSFLTDSLKQCLAQTV